MKIGIPRSILYYDFHKFFKEFFTSLNMELIVSPKTNINILNNGILNCVDEACLPIKIYHGHVLSLRKRADYIFVPRIISSYKREYYCPKQLGLADMILNNIDSMDKIIDPVLYLDNNRNIRQSLYSLGKSLGKDKKEIRYAISNSYRVFRVTSKTDVTRDRGRLNILVTGHPYNIDDDFINMNIKEKLNNKVNLICPKNISLNNRRKSSSGLKKRIFWTHGNDIIGSTYYSIDNELIDGIIYLSAFGCGLDSVLINLVEKKADENEIPLMIFNLDEQTGEAGFNTRLEAYLDMLDWRLRYENKLSTSR